MQQLKHKKTCFFLPESSGDGCPRSAEVVGGGETVSLPCNLPGTQVTVALPSLTHGFQGYPNCPYWSLATKKRTWKNMRVFIAHLDTSLPLTSPWLRPSHTTMPNCKGGWEIKCTCEERKNRTQQTAVILIADLTGSLICILQMKTVKSGSEFLGKTLVTWIRENLR